MTMTMLTILQIAQALAVYSLVTLVMPGILLHKRFARYRRAERFIGYFLIGNFYIINLVFLLQFLHLSSTITLWIGSIAPFFPVVWKKRKQLHPIVVMVNAFQTVISVLRKELGIKTLLLKACKNFSYKYSKRIKVWIRHSWPDVVFTALIVAGVFYIYGTNTATVFGYKASDVPVHNLWINEMEKNNIFANGVYPHGFHCVIYYLHATFKIRTYVLLRVFCVVQTLFIHLALLVSLKVLCRERFTPYMGTIAYLMLNIYSSNSVARYSSTLPQEFGMLFIFPAGVLAIRFFEEFAAMEKATDEWQKSRIKKRILDYLAGFAISFSLTLTVHFYNTMPAGVLCMGIAVGFCFRFCHWRYFWRIIVAGLASIILAVVPMAIGVAMGHPLQGSLYWALGVMNGDSDEDSNQEVTIIKDKDGKEIRIVGQVDEDVIKRLTGEEDETAEDTSQSQDGSTYSILNSQEQQEAAQNKQQKPSIVQRLKNIATIILSQIQIYSTESNHTGALVMVAGIISLLLFGLIAFLQKQIDYAGTLWSIGFYMLFMCVMQALTALGLPELMQPSRLCIFFCYSLGLVWALNADAFIVLVFGWLKRKWVENSVCAVMAVGLSVTAVVLGLVRTPMTTGALETNGAMICLTNIIRENKPYNWTILSANDEHQMIVDCGRHYEMITFLREIRDLKKNPEITFPTEYVYFFIEKQPINYAGSANGIDLQPVSEEGAQTPINTEGGIAAYTSDARWGTMSHMYYWAQAFQKLYPNEMEVYYETDDFVCYRLHQNVECLYNLAIDYGYNNPKQQEEE